MSRNYMLTIMLVAATSSAGLQAGWQDLAGQLEGVVRGAGSSVGSTGGVQNLAQDEMIDGLKEALLVGGQRTISALGRSGGFLSDPKVRISMPDSLKQVEQGLRLAGQGQMVDDLINAMNSAAEQAVPEAASLFGDAISGMSWQDAKGILEGPDDAATRYFQKSSGEKLSQQMLPIIKSSTDKVGVASYYKKLAGGMGMLGTFSSMGDLDLDRYISDKAMDGLFLKLAEEEGRIRKDPVARSTDILKKVFGQ